MTSQLPTLSIGGKIFTPEQDQASLESSRRGKTDGRLFPVAPEDLVRGVVLCTLDHEDGTAPFSDCVVVDIFDTDSSGRKTTALDVKNGAKAVYRMVRLARPYIYVSSAETCCPSVLQGFEQYDVLYDAIIDRDSRFRVRVQSTGKADRMVT